jgi:cob(I)alamin adenosyltransferase
MLVINTGDGKGKTCSAMGIILRTLVLGKKVLLIQFMKPEKEKSILFLESAFPNFKAISYGIGQFVKKGEVPLELMNICKYGFETLQKSYKDHDLIVADELFTALYFDLIDKKDVFAFVQKISKEIDVVLTGRRCPKEFVEIADIVSDIKEVKHHYTQGMQAKEGIDY